MMTSYKEFTIELALQAGALLKQSFQLEGTQASLKSDRSFVTAVDLSADSLITRAIHQEVPNESILSEESSTNLTKLDPAVWVVDPLDGTTNFSLGLHVWGVSIARLAQGQPELGVIFFPFLGELYVAERGQGASLNGSPIHTRTPDPQQPLSFFACCSRTHRRYAVSIPYKPRILGSAAYSFCMLARGTALVAFEATPKVWDLAAAWLLVQEAGGRIAAYDGEAPFPLAPLRDYASTSFPTLAAASDDLFLKSIDQIKMKS